MSIGPVYWGAHPGETLEKLMAVLVAQEEPGVIRRTPSSGDGGVDVLSKADDGWHVRQIKGFVGRMTPKKRAQVEKSFALVLEQPRLDAPIVRWTLSVPIDPTSGEQSWFEALTAGAPFPCSWDGEAQWHSLAARFPYVIDYYLRDGRGRVEARSKALLSASQASSSGDVSATDVGNHLEALRALLNAEDPHYRYEFQTGREPPDAASMPPGVVLASSRSLSDGARLTVLVFARHRHATEDAPITGSLKVRMRDPDRGIDIADAFADFENFGGAIDLPNGTMDVAIDAPGGLGGSFEGGGGRLVSIPHAVGLDRTRIRIEHPEDGVLAELGLRTVSATQGLRGGAEINATDDANVVHLRSRISPPDSETDMGRLNFVLKVGDIDERPVQDVLPALRLFASLAPPNRIVWLEPYGTQEIASTEILHAVEFFEPAFLQFFENLATMQSHVRGTVVVPSVLTAADMLAVAEVAHLVRNGSIGGTWTELTASLHDGVNIDDLPLDRETSGALVIDSQLSLVLDGCKYDLGPVRQVMKAARLAVDQPADGRSITLIPGDDNTMTKMLGSPDSIEQDDDARPMPSS